MRGALQLSCVRTICLDPPCCAHSSDDMLAFHQKCQTISSSSSASDYISSSLNFWKGPWLPIHPCHVRLQKLQCCCAIWTGDPLMKGTAAAHTNALGEARLQTFSACREGIPARPTSAGNSRPRYLHSSTMSNCWESQVHCTGPGMAVLTPGLWFW